MSVVLLVALGADHDARQGADNKGGDRVHQFKKLSVVGRLANHGLGHKHQRIKHDANNADQGKRHGDADHEAQPLIQ